MKIALHVGSPVDLRCDLLAIPVFEDQLRVGDMFQALDRGLGGLLGRLLDEEQFKGKKSQSLSVHTHGKMGPQRILFLGMGPRADFHYSDLRHVAARSVRSSRGITARAIVLMLGQGLDDERALQMASEGFFLGRYRFDRYLSAEDARKPDALEMATLLLAVDHGQEAFNRIARRAEITANAVMRARDLVNEPASEVTPTRMAAEAQKTADKHGLEVRILGPKECRELGMGMFLAVAQGSDQEPRFIHLTYKPKGKARKRVCLVGKGVTFDSGGLSLKPSNAMEDMKVDMSGGAAVISAIGALAELEVPFEIHAITACTENMPSGKAYKLGDVIKSMNGKTVEINNTDAEGRLTLGDAISYAIGLGPDELFDFATLTGACVVALGPHVAGMMTNDQSLADRWLAAAKLAGEDMWQLPLPERLKDMLKSEIADMRNTGERYGGALTAGLFLREFVGKTPWVHVDIAGPAHTDKEFGAIPKGGTGFGVATIVEYLSNHGQ
ncbi:MAG: leucyl aminopeptidase [Deltaproteobacteria bacterium]|nr:leucyl aminopeptidase [Deltaproteobacteria bacterium]